MLSKLHLNLFLQYSFHCLMIPYIVLYAIINIQCTYTQYIYIYVYTCGEINIMQCMEYNTLYYVK